MSRSWPVRPGIPAMGHVTSGGAWHPGASTSCTKCAAATRRAAEHRAWQEQRRAGVAEARATTIPDKRKQQDRNACRGPLTENP